MYGFKLDPWKEPYLDQTGCSRGKTGLKQSWIVLLLCRCWQTHESGASHWIPLMEGLYKHLSYKMSHMKCSQRSYRNVIKSKKVKITWTKWTLRLSCRLSTALHTDPKIDKSDFFFFSYIWNYQKSVAQALTKLHSLPQIIAYWLFLNDNVDNNETFRKPLLQDEALRRSLYRRRLLDQTEEWRGLTQTERGVE